MRQLLQCDFTMRFERVGCLQIIQWEGWKKRVPESWKRRIRYFRFYNDRN